MWRRRIGFRESSGGLDNIERASHRTAGRMGTQRHLMADRRERLFQSAGGSYTVRKQ